MSVPYVDPYGYSFGQGYYDFTRMTLGYCSQVFEAWHPRPPPRLASLSAPRC